MVRIVIEVPYQHKELAQALQEAADRVIAVAGRCGGGKAVGYALDPIGTGRVLHRAVRTSTLRRRT